MGQLVGGRAMEHTAASTSQMVRFETEVLTQLGNLVVLTKLVREMDLGLPRIGGQVLGRQMSNYVLVLFFPAISHFLIPTDRK